MSTGGVVAFDQEDDRNAIQELEEELGIVDAKLEKVKVMKLQRKGLGKVFANIYILRDLDPDAQQLLLQENEVDEVLYWSIEEI